MNLLYAAYLPEFLEHLLFPICFLSTLLLAKCFHFILENFYHYGILDISFFQLLLFHWKEWHMYRTDTARPWPARRTQGRHQHRSRGRVGMQWIARRMAGCQIASGREVLRQVKDDTAPPREISIPSMSFPKLITLPL